MQSIYCYFGDLEEGLTRDFLHQGQIGDNVEIHDLCTGIIWLGKVTRRNVDLSHTIQVVKKLKVIPEQKPAPRKKGFLQKAS
jgi:hypothetical protein